VRFSTSSQPDKNLYVCVFVELLGDEVSVLTHGLGNAMPSIDDVDDSRDRVGDASLPPPEDGCELLVVNDEPSSDSDSAADEANFMAGLSFDDDATERTNSLAVSGDALLGDILSQGQSKMLAALSSPSVSSLVTSAATGLTAIRDAVSQVQQSISSHRVDDATDSDILDAEFDFLNDDEFNRTDN